MYYLIVFLPLTIMKIELHRFILKTSQEMLKATKELIIGHQTKVPGTACAPSAAALCAEHPWVTGGRTQRTTGCKSHTCVDTELLQHKTSLQNE